MYSSWEEIVRERQSRKKDKSLKIEIEKYWQHHPPPFANSFGLDTAILCRPIATPNFEMVHFCDKARSLGLLPHVLEYPDRFVGFNVEKRFLRALHFREKLGREISQKINLFKREAGEGQFFAEITSPKGDPVIQFHHDILQSYLTTPPTLIDQTDWFSKAKRHFSPEYAGFLSVLVCHGIWFENFLFDDERESRFVEEIIFPGFHSISKQFGIKPLICRLVPKENESLIDWHNYPLDLFEMAQLKFIGSR